MTSSQRTCGLCGNANALLSGYHKNPDMLKLIRCPDCGFYVLTAELCEFPDKLEKAKKKFSISQQMITDAWSKGIFLRISKKKPEVEETLDDTKKIKAFLSILNN